MDGSYYQMAKQSHENHGMKVVFDDNTINIMNYLHEAK
jgi:hypothetical protein